MRHSIVPLAACTFLALSACSSGNTGTDPGPIGTGGAAGNGGAGGSGGGAAGAGGSDGGANTACSIVAAENQITNAAGQSRSPDAIWDGAHDAFLVVFSDARSGNPDIYGVWIGSDGKKQGDEWPIAASPDVSHSPTVAKSGNGFIVAWYDESPLGSSIKTMALSADGQPVGNPIQFAPSSSQQPRPTLADAFNAVSMAWMDVASSVPDSEFGGVSQAGTPQGAPTTLGQQGTETDYPTLAASDQILAAVYSDKRSGHLNIRASLYDNLTILKHDVLVRDAQGDADNPRVGWDGQHFVAAWEDTRSGDEEIYAAQVSPDGTASTPVLVHDQGSGSANWPSLAASGTGTAVAYYQFRTGAPQVFVSFLGSDGQRVQGDLQVSNTTGSGKARFASIAYDGNEYGVAWEDTRFGDAEIFFAVVRCP